MSLAARGHPRVLTDRNRLVALERSGRYDAAAELAEQLGLTKEAADYWERACCFDRAATQYMRAHRPDKALLLATRAGPPEVIEEALAALAETPDRAAATALRLEAQGQLATAARLQQCLGNSVEAAALYERSEAHFDAARLYHSEGRIADAIRCLERAIAEGKNTVAAMFAQALLFERSGRLRDAARRLQQIPENATEHPAALLALARVLTKLRLPGASRETLMRLRRTGERGDRLSPAVAEFEAPEPSHASTTPKAIPPSTRVLLGRYDLLERVASTATAQVFRARDRVLRIPVAVKLFSPTLLSGTGRDAFFRFEREVEIMRELAHPAVVPVCAYHSEGPAVVLRWMAGGSLADRLERSEGPRVTARQGALIAARVLTALGEAHRRGILHRDVKPANILFDEHDMPYLADFGTAHVADHAQTVTQGLLGTPAYMAPSQRRGQAASILSDLYSVGAVFWHVLSGAPPDQEAPLPSGLTPAQRALAQRLIDVDRLPAQASEIVALLDFEAWPDIAALPGPRASIPARAELADGRLVPHERGSFDTLLERTLEVLTADSETLSRLRHFAAADHPGLVSVLCSETGTDRIWLEQLPLKPERALSHRQFESLKAALNQLHVTGGCHGSVDAQHIGWRGSQPALLFPVRKRTATLAEDLAKLALLGPKPDPE